MEIGKSKTTCGLSDFEIELKNRILIIASEFPPGPGGIGHHAWFLAKELSKLEHVTVDVICPKDFTTDEEANRFDTESSFEIHRFERVKGFTQILRLIKLIKLLLSNRYSHFWSTGKFALWMIWLQRIFSRCSKTLCILHGSEVNLNNSILRKLTHFSINKFQTIVSVSNFTQGLLPERILKHHSNLKVIPNGLDKSDFLLQNNKNLKGSPALLTVGHVSPRKGQHRLIKALHELIKKYPNVHYHMVGRPVNQGVLESLASELNVREYITFHGSVKDHSDLWDYYAAADLFILLSENQSNGDVEGFGIVALEANACGTPVLGAKGCGVEEAVSHLNSGYLVDGDNVADILQGVEFCVENKTSLSSTSVNWANEHNWSNIIEQFKACV